MEIVASNIGYGDMLVYGRTSEHLLAYFRTVLDVLKHHYYTLNTKKMISRHL